jgi:hypothetical protein
MNVREMFHVKHHPGGDDHATTRLRHCAAMALTLLMLAACSSPDDIAAQTAAGSPEQAATKPGAAPALAEPVAFSDVAYQGTAERDFTYGWPAEVSAVPALVERFTAERDTLLTEQKDEWTQSLREFGDSDCFACVNRSYDKTWAVVADLPRFLSLSASFHAYTGGAHGNGAYNALVWDRQAKAAFDPKAMFRSDQALQDALGAPWCTALRAERKQRMGEDFSDDGFFQCPPIADLTVLVGSSDKRAFNRIGLLAAPYVAGSYAEGTYEVTLPVTAKVLDAVKPEYREAFALAK